MPVAGSFIEEIKKYFLDTSPTLILDVGSRDLEESIQISQSFPNARIVAFEPNPIQFKICQEHAKLYPNIEVYEYACSDEEAIVDFFVVEGNIGASSILEPMHMPGGWDNGYQERPWNKISGIKAKRLDTILAELGITQVDVIWIDVQGNELRALKGMGELINNVKMIHAEAALRPYYKGHQVKEELEQWLNQVGFETEFLDIRAQTEHPYGESDLLCIRKVKYA
jgi:FkbM family methyltransferase